MLMQPQGEQLETHHLYFLKCDIVMRVIFCLPIVINPYSFMVHNILPYACGIDFV